MSFYSYCCCEGMVVTPPPPPSLSSSVSAISQITPGCTTGNCIDGVAPKRYRLTFNYSNGSGCGSFYSNTDYILTFDSASSTGTVCFWSSSEAAQKRAGASCNGDYLTLPIASLQMITNGLAVPSPWCNAGSGSTKRYHLLIYSAYFSSPSYIPAHLCYNSNLSNNPIGSTAIPINCLSAFTLPIHSSVTQQQNWAFSVTGSAANLPPSSVTLTPAP